MLNLTNRYPFGAISQRERGREGDAPRRRNIAADIIVSYVTTKEEP